MKTPVLRQAKVADLPALLAIDVAAESASHWTAEQYLQIVSAEPGAAVQRVVLVAEHERQLLGFAVAGALLALTPPEVELENLAVAPMARRQGVATALVQAVLAWAADMGSEAVRLEVRSRNLAATALYQQLGFHVVGERRGYYAGPVDDAVCMECAVGSAQEE